MQLPKSVSNSKHQYKKGNTNEPLNSFTDKANIIRKRSKKNTYTQRGSQMEMRQLSSSSKLEQAANIGGIFE